MKHVVWSLALAVVLGGCDDDDGDGGVGDAAPADVALVDAAPDASFDALPADASTDAARADATADAAPADVGPDAAPDAGSRDTRCDDGTEPVCDMSPPVCDPHEILAWQDDCYRCVNPATCLAWGEPGCATDIDCPADSVCDQCGSSSCPACDDCVPACVPHGCVTEPEPTCDERRPLCGDGQVSIVARGCWICVHAVTCEPVDGECAAEGQSVPVVPNALECCPGLEAIGCDQPDQDGVCPGACAGAFVCARCGNGECGPGENPCNCPADCQPAGQCQSTEACLDHPAPIRCIGAWRCDPAAAIPASHRGPDGCSYTCIFELDTCAPDAPVCPAASDLCRPCPIVGQCEGPNVCLDPAEAQRCRGDAPAICEGLPHVACDGAWACVDARCQWQCG